MSSKRPSATQIEFFIQNLEHEITRDAEWKVIDGVYRPLDAAVAAKLDALNAVKQFVKGN